MLLAQSNEANCPPRVVVLSNVEAANPDGISSSCHTVAYSRSLEPPFCTSPLKMWSAASTVVVPLSVLQFLLAITLIVSLPSSANSIEVTINADACDVEQYAKMPCRCCKMDCWYSIAKSATHELGHMPGQEGEDEAMATLRLIRACMITECSRLCRSPVGPMKKRRFPAMIAS